MRFIGGIIGGVVAGVVGALIWALIAYYAHIQLGIVAWGIGGLVGFGVALGCKGQTGTETGALAAIIAVVSILGGKYATAWAYVGNMAPTHMTCSDDDAKVHIAHNVVTEFTGAGKTLNWPAGQSDETAEKEAEFPKDVWKEASGRWTGMSADEQSGFKKQRETEWNGTIASIQGTMVTSAFKSSFTVLSFVFIGFALYTAFKIGGGIAGGD